MPIQLDCPQCQRHLSVPTKLSGRTTTCPSCRSEFVVPVAVAGTSSVAATVAAPLARRSAATDPAESTPVDVSRDGLKPALRTRSTDLAESTPVDAPVPNPADGPHTETARPLVNPTTTKRAASEQEPRTSGKVAKFIAATPDPAVVHLAGDGKLPELKLMEGQEEADAEVTPSGTNPLLLIGAILFSSILSVYLLLADISPQTGDSVNKKQAREEIQQFYGDPQGSLKRYQQLLREAKQAHSRGDREREKELYRQVMELLKAEPRPGFEFLTGSQIKDEVLKDLLSKLLSDD